MVSIHFPLRPLQWLRLRAISSNSQRAGFSSVVATGLLTLLLFAVLSSIWLLLLGVFLAILSFVNWVLASLFDVPLWLWVLALVVCGFYILWIFFKPRKKIRK